MRIIDKRTKSFIMQLQLLCVMMLFGCGNDLIDPIYCGVNNPIKDIEWLASLVSKATNDTTGEYSGNIWITTYENKDYIISDMSMGFGGNIFRCYNCRGEIDNVSDYNFFNNLNDDDIVYSNVR
jgi:hypothetical protein